MGKKGKGGAAGQVAKEEGGKQTGRQKVPGGVQKVRVGRGASDCPGQPPSSGQATPNAQRVHTAYVLTMS